MVIKSPEEIAGELTEAQRNAITFLKEQGK